MCLLRQEGGGHHPSHCWYADMANTPGHWANDTSCLVMAVEGCTQLLLCLKNGLQIALFTLIQGGVAV